MLALNKITKRFTHHYRPVLDKLSITFHPGEFCIILGSNGSGKSTLLKMISGEFQPDSGELRLNQQPLFVMKQDIAIVAQDTHLGVVLALSVFENILLGFLKNKKSRFLSYQRYRQSALSKLKDFDMSFLNDLDTPLAHLSGGQRQLVATMAALISGPKVLLLDEHTSALDPKMQKDVMDCTLKAIERERILTLMVTHQLPDALRYGNRLIVLQQGQIILDVSGDEKKSLSETQLKKLFYDGNDNGGASCL